MPRARVADAMSAMSLDPYALLVDFYDEWTAPKRDADVPFYVARAREASTPVVELGVGTGRVAIPAAEAGCRVIGVDVSSAMLTEAERRAARAGVADRISFVRGDMRSFVAEPPVELVMIPFRSFLHMLTSDDQLAALRCAWRSLVPGGRLVCNFFTPDPEAIVSFAGRRRLQTEFTDERGRRCEAWAENTYEAGSQRLTVRVWLDVHDGDRFLDSAETALELRMVYRYEFEHLLARAGFEIEALYGGFDERPYGPGPDEMVWVARKP